MFKAKNQYITGIFGRYDHYADIHRFNFFVSKPVKQVYISDVKYPNLASEGGPKKSERII
jgi:hypothetical protein